MYECMSASDERRLCELLSMSESLEKRSNLFLFCQEIEMKCMKEILKLEGGIIKEKTKHKPGVDGVCKRLSQLVTENKWKPSKLESDSSNKKQSNIQSFFKL